jgi:uncharacterized membrane protein YhaH (DUF805 family)
MAQATTFGRRGAPTAPLPRPAQSRPAPAPTQSNATSEEEPLAKILLQLLFSFEGRLDRRTYRLCRVVANVGFLLVIYGLRGIMPKASGNLAMLLLVPILLLGLSIVMIWSTLAMQVKRRHDRDKSWPWLFIGFIPVVGPVWVLIECCWLEGTPGYNRFDDPSKTAAANFA